MSHLLLVVCLIYVQGCSRQLLQTYPAGDRETEAVLQEFSSFLKSSEQLCGCCLDAEAEASVVVSGWFRDHSAELSGYLQAREPGYFRFVAVNPLGQPWYILVTDGETFTSLNVFEKKAYTGSVDSEIFRDFAPPGIAPEFLYYWLTGRPELGDMEVMNVWRDRDQSGFWLQLIGEDVELENLVLFDPLERLILRRVVRNKKHQLLVELRYDNYQPVQAVPAAAADAGEQCFIPGRINLSTRGGAEKLEIRLRSFLPAPQFSTGDFQLEIPEDFEQVQVR